jgi:D-alanyl-D-alanine carboxypeptidase/D-alanyl-D-alanine-endopeptidase (penicillin-binding protein 4)
MKCDYHRVVKPVFIALAALALAATAPSPARAQADDLAAQVERLLDLHRLRDARVGISVVDLESGETIYKRGENDQLVPASNAKLTTTAAALDRLGMDFSFVTQVYRTGTIRPDGVLEGNLVVKGSGDPNISGRFFDGNVYAVFEKWADRLTTLGVKSIDGDIVLDDAIFDREFVHPAWPGDDLTRWYAAPVSALSFNDNCVDITVAPSAVVGAPAQILLSPKSAYVTVQNKTTTVAARNAHFLAFYRKPNTNVIEVKGKVWKNAETLLESVTVHNPTMYFGTVLQETLERKGIECKGGVRMADGPVDETAPGTEKVVSSRSALSGTIAVANKRSQNFYAEQLLKYLGWKKTGVGTFANGAAAVSEFLERLGFGKESYVVNDGSGLSRSNRVSAAVLAGVLRWAAADEKRGEAFQGSLAIAGVEGTLANRMTDPRRKGRVIGKTGYINGVSSLSGYILAGDGKPALAFSIIVNYRDSSAMPKPFQDALCLLLIARVDESQGAGDSTPGGGLDAK